MSAALLPPSRSRKTISLTALIDVVFILLMFFMLTSSFSRWQHLSVDTATQAASTNMEAPKILEITTRGEIIPYPVGTDTKSSHWHEWSTSTAILVRPAADTSVQLIVDALQEINQQGFNQINLGEPINPNLQPNRNTD